MKGELLRKLVREHEYGDKWVDSVPVEIRDSYFDNPYVESALRINEMLMKEAFYSDEIEDIYWFLYEWRSNNSLCVVYQDIEYRFHSVEGFIKYMQLVHGGEWY